MTTHLPGLVACALYLASVTSLLLALHEGPGKQRAARLAWQLAAPALLLHVTSIVPAIIGPGGLDFGLFKAASLFFWAIATVAYLTSFRLPLGNLLLVLYPLSAVALLTAEFLQTPATPRTPLGWGLGAHILLSILAYSIFSIAAVQAAALALLINRLKHRRLHGVVDLMPPLATMESLLFRLIWTGEALLATAILTGMVFLEDIFAQHLAHKTTLSIVAWGVFAVLLWGRHRLGWRGHTAIRWTLAGFCLLILGYFGSKFVLQILLTRN